jgi:hypothetical protein
LAPAQASTPMELAPRGDQASGNPCRRKWTAARRASCARSVALGARCRSASASRRRAEPWAARSGARTSSEWLSDLVLDRPRRPLAPAPSAPRRVRAFALAPQPWALTHRPRRAARPLESWSRPTTAPPSALEAPPWARCQALPGAPPCPLATAGLPPPRAWFSKRRRSASRHRWSGWTRRPPPTRYPVAARVLSADRRQA